MIVAVVDVSTQGLVVGGIITALGTAGTTVYTAWRAAKHHADERDANLAQAELSRARERIRDLEEQVKRWETIWKARESASPEAS